jgi:hypothetical protein
VRSSAVVASVLVAYSGGTSDSRPYEVYGKGPFAGRSSGSVFVVDSREGDEEGLHGSAPTQFQTCVYEALYRICMLALSPTSSALY